MRCESYGPVVRISFATTMSNPTFIDLSHPLTSSTQIYPGDPSYTLKLHSTHADGCCVHRLALGTHTGTHIDAPYHFLTDGATIDALPISACVGPALIVDLSAEELKPREAIAWARLAPHFAAVVGVKAATPRIVLINTGWARAHYQTPTYLAHPYLLPEVASELLARGVQLVGTDTLNPDETPVHADESPVPGAGAHGFAFHEIFLGGGAIIAENLTNIEELIEAQGDGRRWIVNLVPLRLVGADGSPVRAFAHVL